MVFLLRQSVVSGASSSPPRVRLRARWIVENNVGTCVHPRANRSEPFPLAPVTSCRGGTTNVLARHTALFHRARTRRETVQGAPMNVVRGENERRNKYQRRQTRPERIHGYVPGWNDSPVAATNSPPSSFRQRESPSRPLRSPSNCTSVHHPRTEESGAKQATGAIRFTGQTDNLE